MPFPHKVELAKAGDAARIATMSRDLIETGLGWSWTAPRIARHVRAPESVVLAARRGASLAGFAIMRFGEEHAHLDLLGVAPGARRAGVGRGLVEWLETSALVAGISIIYLEVRATNDGALAFYERLEYQAIDRIPGYYEGRESAIRMARDLCCPRVEKAT